MLNGQNRRFSKNPQNMWHPAQLPADLKLTWEKPITAKMACITFDTLERVAWQMPYENNHREVGVGLMLIDNGLMVQQYIADTYEPTPY